MAATHTTDGDKTISGCTAGCPIIVGHKPKSGKITGCWVRVKSGSNIGLSTNHHYFLGLQQNDWLAGEGVLNMDGGMSYTVVPTSTSVVFNLSGLSDDGDTIYFYKQ